MPSPPATDFVFAGTLSFEDYLNCRQLLGRTRRLCWRSICFVYGLAMLGLGAFYFRSDVSRPCIALGAVMLLYPVFIGPLLFRLRVRRIWNRYPDIREPMNVKLNREGFTTSDDKGHPSFVAWKRFVDYR